MGGEVLDKISSLYVGVGVGTYDHEEEFGPLRKAVTEAREIGKIFEAYGYEVHVIENPDSIYGKAAIKAKFLMRRFEHDGCLVVLWSGHGAPAPERKLGLVTKDGKLLETPEVTPDYLAGLAARTGANQILLILDTCFSGGAIISAGAVINDVQRELPPDNPKVWIGIVASAMDYEQASDGAFGNRLIKLLRKGPDPDDSQLWLRWSPNNKDIMVGDLLDALLTEWAVQEQTPQEQTPQVIEIKNAICQMKFPNPHYNPDAPARVVEHLLLAARGVSPGEEGIYFTGRTAQIARIVSWMQAGKPGLFIVTGPAGSGKSAIAGRIVSLSNPEERTQLLAQSPLEHADPGEGSVHAHVYTRGVTPERFCQLIDEQLVRRGLIPKNPAGSRNKWELFGAIERTQNRLVLVVDGLEEAGAEAWRIAEEVIRMLAKECLVLVSTRELPSAGGGGTPPHSDAGLWRDHRPGRRGTPGRDAPRRPTLRRKTNRPCLWSNGPGEDS
jgi:hypothetical protein